MKERIQKKIKEKLKNLSSEKSKIKIPDITVKDYTNYYGKGKLRKIMKQAFEWLNKNKMNIHKEYEDVFDSPDYWGLPKEISSKLDSEEVDFIQMHTNNWIGG